MFFVESPKDEEPNVKKTPEEIRALWKKTILQTMLLIRMEKEKQDLKGKQNSPFRGQLKVLV